MKSITLARVFTLAMLASSASFAQTPWQRATTDITWGPKVGEAVIAHDDKLWIFGGDRSSSQICSDDVWSSEDGAIWERVLEEAPWGARSRSGAASFKGRMWLMGGNNCNNGVAPDVWSSEDGIEWKFEGIAPWDPREAMKYLCFRTSFG